MDEFAGESVIDTMLDPETKNFPHAGIETMLATATRAIRTLQRRTNTPRFLQPKIVTARNLAWRPTEVEEPRPVFNGDSIARTTVRAHWYL